MDYKSPFETFIRFTARCKASSARLKSTACLLALMQTLFCTCFCLQVHVQHRYLQLFQQIELKWLLASGRTSKKPPFTATIICFSTIFKTNSTNCQAGQPLEYVQAKYQVHHFVAFVLTISTSDIIYRAIGSNNIDFNRLHFLPSWSHIKLLHPFAFAFSTTSSIRPTKTESIFWKMVIFTFKDFFESLNCFFYRYI